MNILKIILKDNVFKLCVCKLMNKKFGDWINNKRFGVLPSLRHLIILLL